MLQVIWLKNDKPVKESQDIQLLFEGDRCTLVVREALAADSGYYKVVARNPHGVAESGCKLHVERKSGLVSSRAQYFVEICKALMKLMTPPKKQQQ